MKLIYSICLVFFSVLTVAAQEMQTSFSDKMKLTPNKTGYYERVLGETEKYIFVEYKTVKKRTVWLERIGVIDKVSMKEVNSLKIVDGKDKERTRELGDREKVYVRFVGENIFVFYKEETKTEVKMYAECYGVNLDKTISMKELVTVQKDSKKDRVFPVVSVNNQSIVVSRFESEDNAIHYIYSVFDLQLEELDKNEVELPNPEAATEGNSFSVNNFFLGNNGMIYFNQTLRISTGKKKNSLFLRADASKYEFYLTVLNLSTGDANLIDMNVENKSLFKVRLVEDKGAVNILGFFCDFEKDPDGLRTHGFFFRKIDEGTMEVSDVVYSYFDEQLLNELFKADQEDKLKTKSKKKNREENAERDLDAISRSFTIENVRIDEAGNLVMFCSKMNNYSYQVCTTSSNGQTSCRTVYECEKRNVTVFKMSAEGEFIWASNIDRRYIFSGWDIYDLRVIEDEENYYVSYASYTGGATEEDGEEAKKKKTKNKGIDYMEYGVINKETGSNEKKSVTINEPGISKSEKKYCSAKDIQVFNNQYFLVSKRQRVAPWVFATCLCPPVFVVLGAMTKVAQSQDVYIGRIELAH